MNRTINHALLRLTTSVYPRECETKTPDILTVGFVHTSHWIIVDNDHTNNMVNFLGFFFNFWRPLISLFRTSGDVCPGFLSQGGSPCLPASLSVCNRFLRFTLVWHLATSWQQHGSRAASSMYLCPSIGGSRVQDQAWTWWSFKGVYFSILSTLYLYFKCVLQLENSYSNQRQSP